MSVFIAFSGASEAAVRDKYIDNAQLCTRHLGALESRYNIPKNLLAAIASTESGRWHDTLNMPLPWPWTANVEGKGYYFNSKSEALREIRQFQREGKESIDVGCMQVNLKHHPKAFASLADAFDPEKNTAYAAKFLRSNYDESHSWLTATAAYHSRTPTHGRKYLGLIERQWTRIADRVMGAGKRSGVKSVDLTKPRELSNLQKSVARDALHTHTGGSKSTKKRSTSRTMRVISVSDRDEWEQRRKSVMLITPNNRRNVSKPSQQSQRDKVQRNTSMIVADGDVQTVRPATNSKPSGVSIKVTDETGQTTRSRSVGSPVFIFSE